MTIHWGLNLSACYGIWTFFAIDEYLTPHCLFESHGDQQVSYQYRALFNLSKIWWKIICGEKFNKYSKIHIVRHCFLFIFFADICGLINQSFKGACWRVYWHVGTVLKKIVWECSRWYKSVRESHGNRIKVSKMV